MISDHPKRFEFNSAAKFYHRHYHSLKHIFRIVLYNGSIVFLNNDPCICGYLISKSEHISVRYNNGGLKRMIIWH